MLPFGLRQALRSLRRAPAFTLAAVATLGLGIGANTAIFSAVNAVLLHPLAYPDPDRLVVVWGRHTTIGRETASLPDFLDWRAQASSFEALAAMTRTSFNVTGAGEPEVVNGGIADAAEATTHLGHVDGAMLGRAAYHTPYLLHELDVAWFGGELRSRGELLRAYRPYVEAQLERGVFLKHIVRHVLGLFAGQPGGRAFRQVLSEGAPRADAGWELIERALAVTERREDAA